ERLQGRKLLVTELVDPLRRAQILEPMLTEIAELVATDERRRRRRYQHLPTVTGRGDTRGPMKVRADITFLRQQRRPGVKAHPHRQLELALSLTRHLQRTRRGRKGDEERVAL